MPRKQDPISRIINDYASLDTAGRAQVDSTLRGFRLATTGGSPTGSTARRAPVTPRATKPVTGVVTPSENS